MKKTWKLNVDFPMEARIGVLIGLENRDGVVICRGGSTPSVSALSPRQKPGHFCIGANMGMNDKEKARFLANLERDLPGMRAKLSQLKSEMRGLSGSEKEKKGRQAVQLKLEIDGTVDTIKALKRELGK